MLSGLSVFSFERSVLTFCLIILVDARDEKKPDPVRPERGNILFNFFFIFFIPLFDIKGFTHLGHSLNFHFCFPSSDFRSSPPKQGENPTKLNLFLDRGLASFFFV